MAVVKYITKETNIDGSKSIVLTDSKLEVKPDNSGNVQFIVTDDGLKGNVAIPVQGTFVTGGSIAGNIITLTKSDNTTVTIQLPAIPVDVRVTGLKFERGKLKGTLSDGTGVETEFTLQVITQALQNATEQDKQAFKAVLLDIIKGEELKDTNDTLHGYLLPA